MVEDKWPFDEAIGAFCKKKANKVKARGYSNIN
jgi:hypothetical protein